MHDYIGQKLYEERATRLRADAATYRLARSAVRRPRDQPRRRPWWHRLSLGARPANLRPREHADHVERRSPLHRRLRVLREVGLVRDRKAGKQRLYGLDARGLRPVHEWTGGFERFWNESFDRLDAYVQDLERARRRSS